VVLRPRITFAELVRRPAWWDTWALVVTVVALCATALLTTEMGQQALVDERVRVIETFGGTVSDEAYAGLQANPPLWVYLSSGSRMLLTPVVTLLVAAACWIVARREGVHARFVQTLSIVVHASVVLALGQLVATPLHFVRESLTSPLNLAAVLPLMEEGTLRARFFGAVDIFAAWWMCLIAVGLSALTGRRARRYAFSFAAVYFGFAAIIAVAIAALGGI
jgi:hypothetical protein